MAGQVSQSDLNSLLREVITSYKAEVVAGGKLHELFAMDFLNSHHHTDRRDAAGLNEHRKNLGILKSLLFTRKDLLLRFSAAEAQDDTLLKDLLHLYYTTEAPPPKQEADTPLSSTAKQNHSLSLGCCLDDDQLSLIADCANEARMFVEELDASMLRSLLEGKLTVPLRSRNNRMLAYFFDQLCRHGLILPRWQNLLEQAGSILGPKGNKPLKHEQYSNALTHARNTPNSMQKKIRECVQQVQKQLSNDGTANK